MKRVVAFIFFLCLNWLNLAGQAVPIPDNYSIVDSAYGDLDKDGISELAVAYNTQKEKEDEFESITRELIIYKQKNNNLELWKKSKEALLGSHDGGMMGDPFGDIKISKGVLIVYQDGGSSWKWWRTDKYQYKNGEFRLIGYSSLYGRICAYWETVDFNLVTGKMIVEKEYENCENSKQEISKRENETFFKKGLKISFEKRHEKEITIITPKYKHEIYIATRNE